MVMPLWLRRLRARFRYRHFAEDVEAELRLHRELTEETLAPSEQVVDRPHTRVTRIMGNELRAREDARAVWVAPLFEHLIQDLQFFARQLRAAPTFAATAIGLSGVGIGALVAVFTIVNAVLFTPLPYPDSNRMLLVSTPEGGSVDGMTYHALRARAADVLTAAVVQRSGWNVVAGDHAEFVNALRVSPSYFDVIGVAPRLGRALSGKDEPTIAAAEVVISDALWRRAGSPADVTLRPPLITMAFDPVGEGVTDTYAQACPAPGVLRRLRRERTADSRAGARTRSRDLSAIVVIDCFQQVR